MCGILGTTRQTGVQFESILQTMTHRGPDAVGLLQHGRVTLGHRRLSIIDTSEQGNQPLITEDGRFAITFNGEIYNYQSLRSTLETEGERFTTHTDTEVILLGYRKHGQSFFNRLRGMWAFAISDTHTGDVLLSRDHFGIKPLFYSVTAGDISFASEMKAVKKLVPQTTFNTDYYPIYFALGYFPAPHTQYKEIISVLPGEIVTYSATNNSTDNNFLEPVTTAAKNTHLITDEKIATTELHTVLKESIDAHFVSDVPVSLLFSGGNDSSLIAALAKASGHDPVAFHLNVEGSQDSEYARKIAGQLGLHLEYLSMTTEAVSEAYYAMFDQLDIPLANPSYIPTNIIYKQISGKSKVVLSGEGGDELFGGYLRHHELARHDRVRESSVLLNLISKLYGQNKMALQYFNPLLYRLQNLYLQVGDDVVSTYIAQTRNINYPVADMLLRNLITNCCMNEISPNGLAPDRFMYLPNDLLLKNDLASMASSVEARVPLVDKELWRFVTTRLDPGLCLSSRYKNKRLLRNVLKQYIDPELVDRPKGGFSFSLQRYQFDTYDNDLAKAIQFHREHSKVFGLERYRQLLSFDNTKVIHKKYPRFGFGLVVNYKLVSEQM